MWEAGFQCDQLCWEQQSLNHWDGTSRQTSTRLPPLDAGFPLPQQQHDINAIAPSHCHPPERWRFQGPPAAPQDPRGTTAEVKTSPHTATQTWAQSWGCTVLNTALIHHSSSHLFLQPHIHAQSRLHSTQWTDCTQPHAMHNAVCWAGFALPNLIKRIFESRLTLSHLLYSKYLV